ncbi:MAG: serine protease [Patescibacteria group bacterium]|nr:serine protease [Patescibacteria group bacterium]
MQQAQKQTIKPHHHKPFRKRHLSAFVISFLLFVFSLLQFGILQGINRPHAAPSSDQQVRQSSLTRISSVYGFGFTADTNQLIVDATKLDERGVAHDVAASELIGSSAITSAKVKPRAGTVERTESAAEARIEVLPDPAILTGAINSPANKGLSATKVARSLFAPPKSEEFTSKIISEGSSSIGGATAYKTVYELIPNFAGGKTYVVVWSGVTRDSRAFAVTLQGLVGTPSVPMAFTQFFKTLSIATAQQVKGASVSFIPQKVAADTTKLDPKYLSDAVSPAVVKIYHLICGALTIDGNKITDDACSGFTGSGFLVTSNGYIATNGHVVVYGAQDALVDILTHNPNALTAFLRGVGLTGEQVQQVNSNPVTMASIIAKIYDIPDEKLHFENKKDVELVAIGSTPPHFEQLATSTDISRYQRDSNELKTAKIIGYNYVAKDKLTAIADPAKGFTASDVALIKIDVQNAPTIALSKAKVMQNQRVFLVGFPGDADNELTDNTTLGVSVTDGVISSIRQAAGKNGLLYQSDADASHGNSGGPAIDESGNAIGLLTYRASGDASGNAAKSYIRDIQDFSELANKLNVGINSDSSTQRAWLTGLDLYAKNHYSAAQEQFKKVQEAYPAQRLVAAYLVSAQAAIDSGKDTKQVPTSWLVTAAALAFCVAALSAWLIVRHHGKHQVYKAFKQDHEGSYKQTGGPGLPHHVH